MQFANRKETLEGLRRLDNNNHIIPLVYGINAFLSVAGASYRQNKSRDAPICSSMVVKGIDESNKTSLKLLQDYLNFSVLGAYRKSMYLNNDILTNAPTFQSVYNTVSLMFRPISGSRTTQDIEKDIVNFSVVIGGVLENGGLSFDAAKDYLSRLGGIPVSLVMPVMDEQ